LHLILTKNFTKQTDATGVKYSAGNIQSPGKATHNYLYWECTKQHKPIKKTCRTYRNRKNTGKKLQIKIRQPTVQTQTKYSTSQSQLWHLQQRFHFFHSSYNVKKTIVSFTDHILCTYVHRKEYTYDASELSFDGLITRLNLLSHQLKLISFLPTLVKILAEY